MLGHYLGHFGAPAESLCAVCASLEGALSAVSEAVWRGALCVNVWCIHRLSFILAFIM